MAARYASIINSTKNIILTKPDSLAGIKEFQLADSYILNSKKSFSYNKESDFLYDTEPTYRTYEGYGDISEVRKYDLLPNSLKQSINDFERFTNTQVSIVSIGPEAKQTITR